MFSVGKTLAFSLIAVTTCLAMQPQDLRSLSATTIVDINNLEFPNNFTAISNQINDALKSLNSSDIEVNIMLNRAAHSTQIHKDLESLRYLFWKTITREWNERYTLQRIVAITGNITIYEILYEVLWQELEQNRYKSNPSQYIMLNDDIQNILAQYNSSILSALQTEIQSNIIEYSSQVLRSYFIQYPTIEGLLLDLKSTNHSNIYERTIQKLFESLDTVENQWVVSKNLLGFDSNTSQAVLHHIQYIKYLKSVDESIPATLYDNLELLISRPDFINISTEQRQQAAQLLTKSMGNLFRAKTICIKNLTTNAYLYECPQTYLMCTNSIVNSENPLNRKMAAFDVERLGNRQYTLRSPYWLRFLRLQDGNRKNTPANSTSLRLTAITKNLYSQRESSNWLIEFHVDYATIRDFSKSLYICGGDPSHWSKMENHAYTIKSNDFNNNRNQCLWFLEDCSDIN